jgi:predicted DNA-binding transcriptional regulator YafY
VPGTSGQTLHAVSDESIELVMTVETVEQIVPWILGFGDQVEVIEPEELKDAVCERARRIVRRYEDRPA